jgi:hypothetical protein
VSHAYWNVSSLSLDACRAWVCPRFYCSVLTYYIVLKAETETCMRLLGVQRVEELSMYHVSDFHRCAYPRKTPLCNLTIDR